MNTASKVVEYQEARVTVSEATVLHGMRRSRLKAEAGQDKELSDLDTRLLRLMTYPDLIAATTEAEGIPWPLSFEDFLLLPERLTLAWEEAVYDLNPHWLPGWNAEEEKKKDVEPATA